MTKRTLLTLVLLSACFEESGGVTATGTTGADAGTGTGSTSGDISASEITVGSETTGDSGGPTGTGTGSGSGATTGSSGSTGSGSGSAGSGSTGSGGGTGSTGSAGGSTGGWGPGPWYQPCDECQPEESCIAHLGGREVCAVTVCELDSDCPPSSHGAQCRDVWNANPGKECSIPCQAPNGPCPQGMVCTTINATGFCIWESP